MKDLKNLLSNYRILVTGTRDWLNDDQKFIVESTLVDAMMNVELAGVPVTIVHGACPTGVDAYVDKWEDHAALIYVERYPADWSIGKFAGPKRNQLMVDKGADVCLAFPKGQSRGTRGCAKMAKAAGIPTIITEL